ncbi:hypothetical protein GDO81_016543 [Engystomops pustulosus]|uniref:Uncharacterized protein n=1 Tax=Engystomops pustulosus TaxID=76066 RepID=A0AAV7AV68_ENGPU|nr:hypothetical protein GDO81_016543 [Engystomops pustulosus]
MQKMSIRFVCITKMPVYQHLSHEELRLKYYEPSVVQPREGVSSPERPRPFVFNNVNNFNFKMSTSRSLTTRSPSDITMGKTAKLCNVISNKSLLPNCLEKSAISTIKKSGRNEKPCKKLKSAACLLKFGSVLSLSAVTDRSANVFGNTEEDMLVSSASSSEEFEDATSNIEADVEEPREGSSSRNTDGGESSSFQKNQL